MATSNFSAQEKLLCKVPFFYQVVVNLSMPLPATVFHPGMLVISNGVTARESLRLRMTLEPAPVWVLLVVEPLFLRKWVGVLGLQRSSERLGDTKAIDDLMFGARVNDDGALG
jgi:hypothetical protein